MGSIANLNASLRWDLDDFHRGTRSIEGGFNRIIVLVGKVADAVGNAGQRMTLGMTLPLTGLGVLFTKAAADAEELQSAFDYTFGNMANRMNRWAEDTGNSMGRATNEMQEGAMAFGQLFQAAAPTEAAAARMSQRFTELAQDAASFFNTDFDTAMGKIRSGLTGEAEPLRAFGVFLNEAAVKSQALEMGLIKSGQELTEYGKIMARSGLIAEGLSAAQGDVERTSDSLSNRVRKIKGDFQELAVEIGEKLMPIAQALAGAVESVVDAFRSLPNWVKNVAVGFGVFLAAIGPVVLVLSTLATAVLPLLLIRFLAMRGAAGPFLAILTAIINPIGALAVGVGKAAMEFGLLGRVLGTVGSLLGRIIIPLGVVLTVVGLLTMAFRNSATEAERLASETEDLDGKNRALELRLRAAGIEVDDFGDKSNDTAGDVDGLASSMDGASRAGQRLIQTLSTVAKIKDLQREMDWLDRKRERIEGIDVGGGRVQVETGGFLGVGIRKKEDHKVSKADQGTIDAIDRKTASVGRRIELLAATIGKDLSPQIESDGPAYAIDKPSKVSTPRSPRTPRTPREPKGLGADEIAWRKDAIRLEHELQLARIAGDDKAIEALEKQQDLRRLITRYQDTELSTEQARVAAEMDLAEIGEARAKARRKEADEIIAERVKGTEYQVALLNNDYAHLRFLEDETDLARRINEIQGDSIDLVQAETLAREELLQIEMAREDAASRRLRDQREAHALELARIRGDDGEFARREGDMRIRNRTDELMDTGRMSKADALAQAQREAADRSMAHTQGTFRDAFRNGLQAALDGNLGDYFEGWMRERTFNALSKVLDRLADSLANLVAGTQGGGGGGLGGLLGGLLGIVTGSKPAAATGGADWDNWSNMTGQGGIPKLNRGGTIKGHPGIDRNLLSLNGVPTAMVGRGEQLSVTPANDRGGRSELAIRLGPGLEAEWLQKSAGQTVEIMRAAGPGMLNSASAKTQRDAARPIMPGGATG